ncbi:aminotransferase IV [Muricauda sp. JGD-17]|uniref:Aminotransferase IV n=1 Tax=Flagellimonas ochracea TaxID=2696472 RepID=A0A964WY09_9FLAO|nr:aminotransferase class IV [Allomuricauda ochracea]NAY92650.1 aminotransferase IV [Allomuricauda ochracea]
MLPKGTFPSKVFLNGEIVDSNAAKISVFDRGFLFGDGIYEVMVQLENGIFYKNAHLQRMQDNLKKIGIAHDIAELDSQIPTLLHACQLEDSPCLIYLQVTRGVAARKHAFPSEAKPTAMMYALPYSLPHINQKNMKVVSMEDKRWHQCDIKSISLLGNVLANQSAMVQNTDEAILVRDGFITEGSHTNIFFVGKEKVYTHPANHHILDGITRRVVIDLCQELQIPLFEKAIKIDDIPSMDEAFLTGTTTQIASVGQIDNHVFYQSNTIGKTTKKLQEAFAKLKELNADTLAL